jgi:hypothetical protein
MSAEDPPFEDRVPDQQLIDERGWGPPARALFRAYGIVVPDQPVVQPAPEPTPAPARCERHPRLLHRGQAAAYCGVSAGHFDDHIATAVPPISIGRRKLWDVRALDRYLDRLSGLDPDLQPVERWLEGLGNDHPRARH